MSIQKINNRILAIAHEATEDSKALLEMINRLAIVANGLDIFDKGAELENLLEKAKPELENAMGLLMQSERTANEIIAIHNRSQ